MTLAEKLKNEGHKQGLEQGIEQGIEQGLVEGLEFAVSIKFGDTDDCKTVIIKIKSIKGINRLKALKGIIKSAHFSSQIAFYKIPGGYNHANALNTIQ